MPQSGLKATLMHWFAKYATTVLCVVLFVCANTNSSCVFYQPDTPLELKKFSKVK